LNPLCIALTRYPGFSEAFPGVCQGMISNPEKPLYDLSPAINILLILIFAFLKQLL